MRKLLLGSLEGLEDQEVEFQVSMTDEEIDHELSTTMLAIMEDRQDLDSTHHHIAAQFKALDEIETSVEQLENIRDLIVKYGISRPMMEVADRHGELVAAGICCAYEELSENPVADTNADLAIEGIGSALKAIISKVGKVFVHIGRMFKDMHISGQKSLNSFYSPLTKILPKLQSGSFDDEKFKSLNVRALHKSEFDQMSSALEQFVSKLTLDEPTAIMDDIIHFSIKDNNDLESVVAIRKRVVAYFDAVNADPSVKDVLGINIINHSSTAVQSVRSGKLKFTDSRKDVSELGWETSDVISAVTKSIAFEDHFEKIWDFVDKLTGVCDKLSALNDEYYEYYDSETQTSDVVAAYGDFTKIVVDFSNALYDLVMVALKSYSEVGSSALQVGYAALKAKH